MVSKADFSPEDWIQIVASPMLAAMAITVAAPSGPWGLLEEAIANGRSMVDARRSATANPIAKSVAEDFENAETRTAAHARIQSLFRDAKPCEIRKKAIDEIRSASDLLDRIAPHEAVGFKVWLEEIAMSVAEAAKEGGFLGLGGVPVSEAEEATLAEISRALNRVPVFRGPVER